MSDDPTIKLHRIPAWVLTEPVDVTLVIDNPDAVLAVYLIARTTGPGAITVHYSEDGIVVNGVDAGHVEEEAMLLCDIADVARDSMIEGHFDGWSHYPILKTGKTVRLDPTDMKVVDS